MSVLSDLQRSAELNRDAFAACRRALTQFKAARQRWGCKPDCTCYDCAAIKGARTSMAKAERGESRES